MNEQVKQKEVRSEPNEVKKSYQTPVLKEHGSAKDVTLQTFFGTFSPPASN